MKNIRTLVIEFSRSTSPLVERENWSRAMIKILALVSTVFCLGCSSQNDAFSSIEAFTYHGENGLKNVELFNQPNGAIVTRLKPANFGTGDDTGHMVKITDSESGYFRVTFDELNYKNVWIKQGKLALNLRLVEKKNPIKEKPNNESKTLILMPAKTIKILDVYNGWVLTEVRSGGSTFQGWVGEEWQCGNPYTTCP